MIRGVRWRKGREFVCPPVAVARAGDEPRSGDHHHGCADHTGRTTTRHSQTAAQKRGLAHAGPSADAAGDPTSALIWACASLRLVHAEGSADASVAKLLPSVGRGRRGRRSPRRAAPRVAHPYPGRASRLEGALVPIDLRPVEIEERSDWDGACAWPECGPDRSRLAEHLLERGWSSRPLRLSPCGETCTLPRTSSSSRSPRHRRARQRCGRCSPGRWASGGHAARSTSALQRRQHPGRSPLALRPDPVGLRGLSPPPQVAPERARCEHRRPPGRRTGTSGRTWSGWHGGRELDRIERAGGAPAPLHTANAATPAARDALATMAKARGVRTRRCSTASFAASC